MLQKYNLGFTLIELLVAVAIIGVLSVVSVNLLFSTVLSRARQGSIQSSSEDVRNFISLLSKSVKESNKVDVVSATEIVTTGTICRTFHLEGTSILLAQDNSSGCVPPTASPGDPKITDENTEISSLNISQNEGLITVILSGSHKDSFGKHDFSYDTKIAQRTF